MDLDKSLDTILSEKPKQQRRPQKSAAAASGSRPANGVSKKTAASARRPGKATAAASISKASKSNALTSAAAVNAGASSAPAANKIIVHGLPADVTEKQIREYMAAEVGPVARLELSYNSSGQSKGVATVQFGRGGDYALKAANLLNGRVVDGSGPRPTKMRVEIVQSVKEPGLAERLGASKSVTAGVAAGNGRGRAGQASVPATAKVSSAEAEALARAVAAATSGQTLSKKQKSALRKVAAAASASPATTAAAGGRAASTVKAARKAGIKTQKLAKSGPGRVKRVAKSAAELDAEMTDYFDKGAKAAASATQ
ncbi:RNA-binding RNA annealing protein [Savitreella phatthalungensis]